MSPIRDHRGKEHPDLLPLDELPESEKVRQNGCQRVGRAAMSGRFAGEFLTERRAAVSSPRV
jgi:hypothetical protein